MATLHKEFEAWTTGQGLSKDVDAGELILLGVTDTQCDWLCKFIERWEASTEYQRWGLSPELTKPVLTIDDAKAWIRALVANNMLFHLEDSPETVGNTGSSGEWVELWTKEDAKIIGEQRDQVYAVFGAECPIGYSLDLTSPGWRDDGEVAISAGRRVVLVRDVENFPVGIFRAGETGTVKAIHEYMIEVVLDRHHVSLDEWENVLQIHDNSELNGDEEKPEAYLRVLET